MSNKKIKRTEKTIVQLSQLPVENPNKKSEERAFFVLSISEEVLQKIRYLCDRIRTVEWSGIVFYSIKGSIKNPESLRITLEDILPMDKGTQAATEFEYDGRYTDFIMKNTERLDWKHGIIHSHNFMSVFFSGTDIEDLKKNSKSHNYYLSVVVNNNMDIIAKIAFVASSEVPIQAKYYALDDNGERYLLSEDSYISKKEKFIVLDANIEKAVVSNSQDTEFTENVDFIMKPKVEPFRAPINCFGEDTSFNRYDINSYQRDFNKPTKFIKEVKSSFIPGKINPFESPTYLERRVESFIKVCLEYENGLELSDILNEIEEFIIEYPGNKDMIIEEFFNIFNTEYEKFFPETQIDAESVSSVFMSIMEEYMYESQLVNEILDKFLRNDTRN